ncbi:MAG: DUF134 domain-containing protein [Ignavibacteria bacterium]|jgi:predicted DNA-binding protein (UPF0251 family)|nr:DUF134 domain-containing protein [Ignavibacteria bacterium]
MPRPKCRRKISSLPEVTYFKPRGIPLCGLSETVLSVDEFEAIRLTDLEGLYQEQAADKMGVSRQTLGRIIESARKTVADALINGKALKIDGGNILLKKQVKRCRHCGMSHEKCGKNKGR